MYKKLFIAVFVLFLVFPFGAMAFYKTDLSVEKKHDEAFPSVWEDGEFNAGFFSDVTDYFEDHFAFRQEMVTLDAMVKSKVFQTSNNRKVIVGKDGWLFFQETLDDYSGKNLLDERKIFNCAKVLQLLQENAEAKDSQFLFTIAPNKNSLYGQYMPENITRSERDGNLEHLQKKMKQLKVNYLNLHEPLRQQRTPVYHRWDTHWNNQGAVIACDCILTQLKKKHRDYSKISSHRENNFEADLRGMLYPKANEKDENVIYDSSLSYQYEGEVDSTEKINIETKCKGKKKTLLMFRDSFGNALIPYVADEYGEAFFTKEVPYNYSYMDTYYPDDVIIELAQRQIPTLLEGVPYCMAPLREFDGSVTEKKSKVATMKIENQEDCQLVWGQADASLMETDSDILICFTGEKSCAMFEAFPTVADSSDEKADRAYSYGAYIDDSVLENGEYQIDVITKKGGKYYSTGVLAHYTKKEKENEK